jgi:hypothetical protein|tara:strand:- start:3423 stop:3710 length:288 start_codon:yes stop_codon:yes gene_type:complete
MSCFNLILVTVVILLVVKYLIYYKDNYENFGMDLSHNKPCNSYTTGNVDCNTLPIMGEKKDCLTLKQDCEATFIKLKMESFIDSIASALKKIENL